MLRLTLFIVTFFGVLAPYAARVQAASGENGGGITTGSSAATLPATCDPRFMNKLEARAWLEAQRDVSQNNNLIFKPDSTLQVSCFNDFVDHLSWAVSDIFSECYDTNRLTPYSRIYCGGGGVGLPAFAMDFTLNVLVVGTMAQYLGANFNHRMLGGRASFSVTAEPASSDPFNCLDMYRVYDEARCFEFQTVWHDDFMWLTEHAARESRHLPVPCGGAPWGAHMAVTAMDPVVTYLSQMDSNNCNGVTPVPTGFIIETAANPTVRTYPDAVCPAPGCWYEPSVAGGGGQCRP